MDEHDDAADEGLKQCQSPALYPLGRALRSTYHADNHETLSAEVTALMLTLSRVPYEPFPPLVTPANEADRAPPVARSLMARVISLWGR